MQNGYNSHPDLRLSEVFRQSHKGRGQLVGLYKVCVGRDGRVPSVQSR